MHKSNMPGILEAYILYIVYCDTTVNLQNGHTASPHTLSFFFTKAD